MIKYLNLGRGIRMSKVIRFNALKIISIISIVFCIVVTLTYGRTVLNSDTAIATLFAKSAVENHSIIAESWCYANGDIWTIYPLVGILSIIVTPILGYGDAARVAVVAIQLILGCIAMYVMAKRYFKDESWALTLPLCSIYLGGVELYILYDGCYGDFMLWQPLICMLTINLLKKVQSHKYICLDFPLLFFLLYALSVRGPRTIADFALPTFLAAIFIFYVDIAEKRTINPMRIVINGIYLVISTLLPAILGLITYRWLATWHTINNIKEALLVFPDDLEAVYNGVISTILLYFDLFGFKSGVAVYSVYGLRNFISIIMCIVICILVPILQGTKISKETKIVQYVYVYVLGHNIIFFLCGVFFDFVLTYHLISSVVLFALMSSRYIYRYWICQENPIRGWAWRILFTIATVIECVCLCSNVTDWKDRLNEKRIIANTLLEHGLTKGYATFWNAYITDLYSNDNIEFGAVTPVENHLQEYWWLVDSKVFEDEDSKSFVMLTDEELSSEGYNFDTIRYGYELPIEEFIIPNVLCYSDVRGEYVTNMNVYVYEHDYSKYLVNGSDDGIVVPEEMSFNWLGTKSIEAITMWSGGYVYGPYSNMDKGKYIVTYNGKGLINTIEGVFSEQNNDEIKCTTMNKTDDCINVEMELLSRVEGIQFILRNIGNEECYLYNIQIERQK